MVEDAALASRESAAALLRRHGIAARELAAPFRMWLLPVPEVVDVRLIACLSFEERARAERFRRDDLRRRYMAAHGALRLLGEHCFGIAAAAQRYQANAFGKPQLVQNGAARCSISYSGNWALIACGWGEEIGVDLEVVRPVEDAADLIDLHCTARERKALTASSGRVCDRDFLNLWVRKEACMKAVGAGLAIAPSSFDCGVETGISTVEIVGKHVECGHDDLKGDLAVAWARLRRVG